MNNRFPDIYDYDILAKAATIARDKLGIDAGEFFNDLEGNIIDLQNNLIWKTYKIKPLKTCGVATLFSFADTIVLISLCFFINRELIYIIGKPDFFIKLLECKIANSNHLELVNLFLNTIYSQED